MPKIGPSMVQRRTSYSRLQEEVHQGPSTRIPFYKALEKKLGNDALVAAFITSFKFPAMIQDDDADMLEEVLRSSNKKKLFLLLNAPGGEALAAERIVNVCRSFVSKGNFTVIVPKMAKSAATMICFGADQIWMSPTSELGPIDPQIPVQEGNSYKYLAAHEVIESYNELMKKGGATRGRIEPYLQQLSRFDARDIRQIKSAQQLSESIAVRCLRGGVLSGLTERQVKSKIKPFLDPKYTKVHGRPIYADVASKCGLAVKVQPLRSEIWDLIWKLYIRLSFLVSSPHTGMGKIVESAEEAFFVPGFVSFPMSNRTEEESI